MAEWSIATLEGSNWATGSGVRIPVSPPNIFYSCMTINRLYYSKMLDFKLKNFLAISITVYFITVFVFSFWAGLTQQNPQAWDGSCLYTSWM